jgi:hypothetical protein
MQITKFDERRQWDRPLWHRSVSAREDCLNNRNCRSVIVGPIIDLRQRSLESHGCGNEAGSSRKPNGI